MLGMLGLVVGPALAGGAAGQSHPWSFPFDPFRMECRKGNAISRLGLRLSDSQGFPVWGPLFKD